MNRRADAWKTLLFSLSLGLFQAGFAQGNTLDAGCLRPLNSDLFAATEDLVAPLPRGVGEAFPDHLAIQAKVFKASGGPINDPGAIQAAKLKVFAHRYYRMMADQAGLKLDISDLLLARSNTQPPAYRLYASSPPRGEMVYDYSKFVPGDKRNILLTRAFGKLIGDTRSTNAFIHTHVVDDARRVIHEGTDVYLNGVLNEKGQANKILSDLSPDPESVRDLRDAFNQMDFEPILRMGRALDMPQDYLDQVDKTFRALRARLGSQMDGSFASSEELTQAARASRGRRAPSNVTANLSQVKELIRARFEKEFRERTAFASFDEYKRAVMAIPEYAQFVSRFWDEVRISYTAQPRSRVPILLNGIQNAHQTEVSGIGAGAIGYMDRRLQDEARFLGLSLEQYERMIPPDARATSMFLGRHEPSRPVIKNVYGSDHYDLSTAKVLEKVKRGELYLTMTLGDSLNNSRYWQGRPVPAEDFPYFAAPFITDYRTLSGNTGFNALQYRENGWLPEVKPRFLGGLGSKIPVDLRNWNDIIPELENKVPADFIEAQLYGPISSDLVEQIHMHQGEQPSRIYQDAVKNLGIELKFY